MKIAFFEVEGWEKDILEKELNGHELEFYSETLNEVVSRKDVDADVISVFIRSAVGREEMQRIPSLKSVTTRSTGFDHIDIDAAREMGISVFNVPSYGENTVAEFAIGLLLSITRKIPECIERAKSGRFSTNGLRGTDLKGKTVGVIGTGRIGRHFIKMVKAFDTEVIAYDAYPNEDLAREMGFKYVSLDELAERSDIISVHVPYLPSTHHMINRELIGKMKKGVIIINTARGGVIDTSALVWGLEQGIIGGLGLDVLEEEKFLGSCDLSVLGRDELMVLEENHYLLNHPNVVITPHNAFNTHEALERILRTTIQNILEKPEKNRVA